MLINAYVTIGARVASLLMALAPPIAAVISWFWLDEILTTQHLLGMAITLVGIVMVLLKKNTNTDKKQKLQLSYSFVGILFGIGGAVGQAVGLVLSKKGMGDYDPFLASQIRVLAGAVGFTFLVSIMKRWYRVSEALHNKKAMIAVLIGTFFGPFLGVSFSLIAIQNTSTGIAATIMSIVPIIIIPMSIFYFKEKVSLKEIVGAFIAVGGVALFFV